MMRTCVWVVFLLCCVPAVAAKKDAAHVNPDVPKVLVVIESSDERAVKDLTRAVEEGRPYNGAPLGGLVAIVTANPATAHADATAAGAKAILHVKILGRVGRPPVSGTMTAACKVLLPVKNSWKPCFSNTFVTKTVGPVPGFQVALPSDCNLLCDNCRAILIAKLFPYKPAKGSSRQANEAVLNVVFKNTSACDITAMSLSSANPASYSRTWYCRDIIPAGEEKTVRFAPVDTKGPTTLSPPVVISDITFKTK